MKSQALAKGFQLGSAALLLAFAATGPALAASAQDMGPAASLDRNFLIGSWSDTGGDCSTTVAFTADGLFATGDGAGGEWTLSGDRLILTGAGGVRTLTVIPIDRNTMEVIGEDGSHDRSTRCAGDLGTVHFDDLRIA